MRFSLLLYASCFSVISCSYAQTPDKGAETTAPIKTEQPVGAPSAQPSEQQTAPDPFRPYTAEERAEAKKRWAAHEAEQLKRLTKKFGPLPPGAAKWTEHRNTRDSNNQMMIDEAFVRQVLDTPSPSKAITQRMREMLFGIGLGVSEENFRRLVNSHRGRGGPPDKSELQTFIKRVKANTAFMKGGKFWFGEWGLRPGKNGRRLADTGTSRLPQLVMLSNFSIYKSRVTYADYDVFTRETGRPPAGLEDGKRIFDWIRYPDFPANVSWPEARAYCQWLGQVTGEPFDLPTEAQWEYVARDRGKDVFFAGPDPFDEALLREKMETLYDEKDHGGIAPVGSFGVSALGISDMVGYGYEWMRDWHTQDLLGPNGQKDPTGPQTGTERVIRPASKGFGFAVTLRYGEEPSALENFRCTLSRPTPWR